MLVFETFDKAVKANPGDFHSDRGYQYTSRRFHQKLEEAGMVQVFRVTLTDNGVMESFWGDLKEMANLGAEKRIRRKSQNI